MSVFDRLKGRDSAPLWPAGHLPHTRGDWELRRHCETSPLVGEVAGRPEGGAIEREADAGAEACHAYAAAAAVPDPEVPCVTIADLGILRSVDIVDGVAVARVTPTYSGCPAVLAIELAVEAALREAGFEARVERVMSPPWTTDWITAQGRDKLRAYGIAPPVGAAASSLRALFGETVVACPKCGSDATEKLSEFGSTACKAHWRCLACREPFDYFKCI